MVSYKDLLIKQIHELEIKISEAKNNKIELEKKLQKLLVAEFEEDTPESKAKEQQLLKG
jgi:hypothetical protein